MPQIFERSSNALARMSLVLTGLIVIALGVTLDQLQRSPWVTRQGQRPDQPVPFSHKHHVQGLGLQCQYCHTTVEKSSYAGIPPTKTCMNCHAQIWTNAQLLEPVRNSWATGQSIPWTKVHDLPDFVFFNHSIHVNKGIGCATLSRARGPDAADVCAEHACRWSGAWTAIATRRRICGRPARSTTWPGRSRPATGRFGARSPMRQERRAHSRERELRDEGSGGESRGAGGLSPVCRNCGAGSEAGTASGRWPDAGGAESYQKFTSQDGLGHFLLDHYKIRTPKDLTSCEVCHR